MIIFAIRMITNRLNSIAALYLVFALIFSWSNAQAATQNVWVENCNVEHCAPKSDSEKEKTESCCDFDCNLCQSCFTNLLDVPNNSTKKLAFAVTDKVEFLFKNDRLISNYLSECFRPPEFRTYKL